jgi:hypothetical protein
MSMNGSVLSLYYHSPLSPTYPSDKSSIKVKMSVEYWWNDRQKRNHLEKSQSQCQFIHHKTHMKLSGIEPVPPVLSDRRLAALSYGTAKQH